MVDFNEQRKVVRLIVEFTPGEAKKLCAALYRMQSYHLNNGQGIPAARRQEIAPDLFPLFELYDALARLGYE